MAELEKVIKGLEICSEYGSWHGLDCEHNEAFKDCPYRGCETGCVVTIAKDAIALLKKQEAVEPTLMRIGRNKYYNDYICPRCDNEVVYEQNYCSECGVRFLWEGR